MKKMSSYILLAVIVALALVGCGHQAKQHKAMNMEIKSYDAHFPDMDVNGDGLVSWDEFNRQFADAEKNVFRAIDLNTDGNLNHDEWHEFKAGSGHKMKKSG